MWGKALADEIREVFGHYVTLGAFLEQLPYDDNRVTLSDTMKNELGRPAAKIEFNLMRDYETKGYLAMKREIERIMDALGATDVRVIMEPSIGGHYMGTHRMGHDPETSVTTDRLECHSVKNLFLASSGAFPTGGISNPTLTGVALTMRMADYILGRI
ncbi:MAG: GMC family oxidoreductase [Polyangiaceae bacterium]|nr:GMC family oxidoreductase [Polyangiaceae bacterium]